MTAAVKWNVEYTAPLAGGQQLRVIGNVMDGANAEQIKYMLDEMDHHVTRIRHRHEIPAMEEKQAQIENALEESRRQLDAQRALANQYSDRKKLPTNIQSALTSLESNIPTHEENLALIRNMIEERKKATKSVIE